MKSLVIEFESAEYRVGDERFVPEVIARATRLSFRKIHVPSGRHRVVLAMFERDDNAQWVLTYKTVAMVGKHDVGRYDFFAGCRIAFEKLLRALEADGVTEYGRSFIRRVVQVQLALAQNEEQGELVVEALDRLIAQRGALLKVKNDFMGKPHRGVERAKVTRDYLEALARVRDVREHFRAVTKPEPEPDFKASTPRDSRSPVFPAPLPPSLVPLTDEEIEALRQGREVKP